jgi:Periplasmic copper-binding protein (NosD)
MTTSRRPACALSALAIAAATLCSPGSAGAAAGTHVVRPGQSIQAAIDAARPGDKIVVRSSTYAEQLTVATSGLRLVGTGAVLVPPPAKVTNLCTGLAGAGTDAGICVTGRDVVLAPFVAEHRRVLSVGERTEDVSIFGFAVRGFSGPNVALVGARDGRVVHNLLVDGAACGVISAGSQGTRITDNIVWGGSALRFIGICVDDVTPALVARNHASHYDVGLCIQTQGAEIRGNVASHNCIGIYVDPGIGARIRRNHVSTTSPVCARETAFGAYGIILAGAVGAHVRHNRIDDQHAGGGAVGLAIVDASPTGPFATGNVVTHNSVRRNDLDLEVTTTGEGSVVAANRCETSDPSGLCG